MTAPTPEEAAAVVSEVLVRADKAFASLQLSSDPFDLTPFRMALHNGEDALDSLLAALRDVMVEREQAREALALAVEIIDTTTVDDLGRRIASWLWPVAKKGAVATA